MKDTDQMIKDLIDKLSRKNFGLRIYACNKLGELGAINAIPSLKELVKNDPNKLVRVEAVIALGKIGFKDSIDIIKETILLDKDSLVKREAVKALWNINSFNETSFLIEILRKETSSDVRGSISLLLAKNNIKEAIDPIKKTLSKASNNEEKFALSFALILLEGLESKGTQIISEMQRRGVLSDIKTKQFDELTELLHKSNQSFNHKIQYKENTENKIYLSFVENPDEILQLEESNTLEFKSSLRWNISKNKADKEFEKKRIDTIVAFLNSQGGNLIIGITDSKQVVGLNKDYFTFNREKRNNNAFELYLTELTRNYIGSGYREFINIHFIKLQNKEICCINIRKCTKPVFLPNGDFIIREGNRNQKLTPMETTQYIERHWK